MGLQPNPTTGDLDLVPAPAPAQMGRITGEPTGFQTHNWTKAYDATTRTVTLTPTGTQHIFVQGKRFAFSAPVTSTHPAVDGDHFFVFNAAGQLVNSQTPFNYQTEAHAALVDYDSTQTPPGFGIQEDHGVTMDWATHLHDHKTVGTFRDSGLLLIAGTFATTPAVPANADNTPGVGAGVIYDEDNPYSCAQLADGGPYTRINFTGTGAGKKLTWTVGSATIVPIGATYPQYNSYNSGTDTWSLVEMSGGSNTFMNVYLIACPAMTGSDAFRLLWLPGQAEFATAALAEARQVTDLDLTILGGAVTEFVPLCRITLQTSPSYATTGKFRIYSFFNYSGTRVSLAAVSSVSPTTHNSLGGRDAAGAHPSEAVTAPASLAGALSSATETTAALAFQRLSEFDYVGPWQGAKAYRVGNVVYNGALYRCTTAHTSSSFSAERANWYALGPSQEANQSIAAGGQVVVPDGIDAFVGVQGSGGPVTLADAPFSVSLSTGGRRVTLYGLSNANTVTILSKSAVVNGACLAGDIELGLYRCVTLQLDPVLQRWIEISRSNFGGV